MRAPRPVESFLLEGRISVRQDQTRHYANISWRHDGRSDDIFLATPLGQGVAELHRDENGARLIMADRQQRLADDWEDLAAQLFGIRLPLARSYRWIKGVILQLQADGAGAQRIEVLDKLATGPMVRAYNGSGNPVSATIDALVQGAKA